MTFWWAVFPVLAIAGITAGLVALLPSRLLTSDRVEADPLEPRLRVEVRVGAEQTVIHLAREMGVALRRDDVGYGGLYITGSSDSHLGLASRSEVGRSFEGEIRLLRRPAHTLVEYYIYLLPDGGEELTASLQHLDDSIVRVLRRLDAGIVVRHPRTDGAGRMRARTTVGVGG